MTGVVAGTMAPSWLLDDRPQDLAGRYRNLLGGAPVLLVLRRLMELRCGALHAGRVSCVAGG